MSRVGAGGRGFSRVDKAMNDLCLSCKVPASSCIGGGPRCPYTRKYGSATPKVLIQNECGIKETIEEFGAMKMREQGKKVGREMGIKNLYRIGNGEGLKNGR